MGLTKPSEEEKEKRQDAKEYGRSAPGNIGLFNKGPYGLGDPDDLSLSLRDRNLGMKLMKRRIITEEQCATAFKVYNACLSNHYFIIRHISCNTLKNGYRGCVNSHMDDPGLDERAKATYIEERRLLRSTGLTKEERMNPQILEKLKKSAVFQKRSKVEQEEVAKLSKWELFCRDMKESLGIKSDKPVPTSTEDKN